jgi:hypothetical protein
MTGRTEFQRGKEMTEQIGSLAQVPGALEMLVTVAAEELGGPKGGKSKQLRMYNMGGAVNGYQQGGLGQVMEQQAEEVRQAGRGDDEMLLHLAPEEYEAITSMWGEPDINPTTGVPEYGFLSKLWKGIKKTVKKIVKSPLFSILAPIALNVFAPGLGSAIGGWLGATGKAAATIGNTVLRTGIGAVSGGKTGAISGALSGLTMSGVGADIGKKIGLSGATAEIAGDALLGGVAGEATGVGFGAGATGQAISSMMGKPMQKIERKLTDIGKDIFTPMGGGMKGEFDVTPGSMSIDPNAADPFGYGSELLPQTVAGDPGDISGLGSGLTPGAVLSGGAPQADPSWWDRSKDWMQEHPWLTAGGALGVAGMAGAFGGGGDEGPPDFSANLPPGFNDPLPNLSFDRTQLPAADYFTYGRASGPQEGEASFFEPNVIPSLTPEGPMGSTGGGGPMIQGTQPLQVSPTEGASLQTQGWTYDQNSGMAYPPGYSSGGYGGGYGGPPQGLNVALGGLIQKYQTGGHVRGPGTGRSDDIPAVLSDGEYVIDSESVALLGDGSTDAGARRLDQMREKLRKHKAKKLAKGGFSDAAKKPELYMEEGGKVSTGKTALRNLKRLANRLEQAITSGNKKRVNEITSQLKSLDGGSRVITGLAKGGSVKRILAALERAAESESTSAVGPVEKRVRARRKTGRKEGRRMSDKEKAELLEELGGFKKDSKFIRRFRKDLKEAKKEEGK